MHRALPRDRNRRRDAPTAIDPIAPPREGQAGATAAKRTAPHRRLVWPAAAILLTAGLWVIYGPPHAGYDATWALAWGTELGAGDLPQLDASPAAPTPHPLAIALTALLSLFGTTAAPILFEVLVFASLAWIGLTCFRLGSLFALPVGAAFALIALTRPHLIHQALIASTDVAFLAFTLAAVLSVATAPRRGWAPLALLCAAGLLRPEAWGLAVLYAAYLLAVTRPPLRLAVVVVAMTLVAPIVWVLTDVLLTGDPVFSLRGTQELAVQFDRPRGLGRAVVTLPGRLESVIGEPLLWLGLVGWVMAVWTFYERALVPSAVVIVGIAAYLFLGVADLPLLARYLLLPGVVLALFAAVLMGGWVAIQPGRLRLLGAAAAAVGFAALTLSLPADLERLAEDRVESAASHAAQADLERLVTAAPARRALAACRPVSVHDFRVRPFIWYWAGTAPAEIRIGTVARRSPGSYVTPQATRAPSAEAARTAFHKAPAVRHQLLVAPVGSTTVAETSGWRLDIIGCRQESRPGPRTERLRRGSRAGSFAEDL